MLINHSHIGHAHDILSEPMFFGTAISWQEHIEQVKIGCHLDHAVVGSNQVTQNNEPFFYD